MKKSTLISLSISVPIAVLAAGVAISAQDKYTVQVPNGLGFSEFRGYEDWPVIAISQSGGKIAVIVGNPVIIDAFKEGVPGNGKPFPDGAKMAKIHWNPKVQETWPSLNGSLESCVTNSATMNGPRSSRCSPASRAAFGG